MELDIWLAGRLVAHTEGRDRGRRVRICYEDAVSAEYEAEIPLLSCSLPTPGPSEPSRARAYLEGLLPEGRALEAAAAQVRGVRLVDGAPETARDAVSLLAEFGRECAGAVVVQPSGSQPPSGGRYRPLADGDLAEIVHGLPQHPIGTDLARGVRMSLAGAQPKFLLARVDGRWHEPLDGAPSTHIVKPATEWPHSAHNEALVIGLSRACGLSRTEAWVERMGDIDVFVAERYDRRCADGVVTRLHQEDMCQAIGLRPRDKYQIGRPSQRMTRVLRAAADNPRAEVATLFRHVAFRALVGDEDGHGKNHSLLLNDGVVSLAPMYDSLCTLAYPQLSGDLAAPIGRCGNLATLDRDALLAEASAMMLTTAEASETLDGLCDSLRTAIGGLDARVTAGWPCDQVIEVVERRLDRLAQGTQLGS